MNINIGIIRDEPNLGERALKTIEKKFNVEMVDIESPKGTFIDDINIDKNTLEKLEKFDLLITYIKQADMVMEIVEKLHDKVSWIIIGTWRGEGFKNQLLKYENVSVPDAMCELEIGKKNPVFDEFTSVFGKPEIKVNCQGEKIAEIDVIRGSPCGATNFMAEDILGENVDDIENLAKKAGLRIQHYPCRGHKLRLFADEESHKQLASQLHYESVKKALKNEKDENKK